MAKATDNELLDTCPIDGCRENVIEELIEINNELQDVAEEYNELVGDLQEMGVAAVYKTQIQWGGPDAEWHDDHDLVLVLKNRENVVPACRLPAAGTTIAWYGPNGNGSITFFAEGEFRGSAQFPDEGPVGYRGTLR
jgi:hypothetical protein